MEEAWALLAFLVVLPPVTTLTLILYCRMERKKTNVLNIQLSIVNIISSYIVLPMSYAFYRLLYERKQHFLDPSDSKHRTINYAYCGSLAVVFYVVTFTHFITIMALSLDRFIAVFYPFNYRNMTKKSYIRILLFFWVISITLSLFGILSPDDKEGNPPYFHYKPDRSFYLGDDNIYCEIYFSNFDVDGKSFIPTLGQKVYCAFLYVLPFMLFPIAIVVLGIATLGKILIQMNKQRLQRRKLDCEKSSHLNTSKISLLNCFANTSVTEIEMNERTNSTGLNATTAEAAKATVSASKNKRRLDVHLEAIITLVLLILLFFATDFLWWVIKVSEALSYLSNNKIRMYDSLKIFDREMAELQSAIASRCGIFIYALLSPLLLLWRQKSFRLEFISMFMDVRSMATEFTTGMFDSG